MKSHGKKLMKLKIYDGTTNTLSPLFPLIWISKIHRILGVAYPWNLYFFS